MIDALLPEGPIWEVEPGGEQDLYYESLADDLEIGRARVVAIENTRDPEKTTVLSDLEINFGVTPNPSLSDSARRLNLAAVKRSGNLGVCSSSRLEEILRAAGFDVHVYTNEAGIDPSDITLDGDSEVIINGDVPFTQYPDCPQCADDDDEDQFQCADDDDPTQAQCGILEGMVRSPYPFELPTNPAMWKKVFFVAGDRDGGDTFPDWNMERFGTDQWTDGGGAVLSKALTPHLPRSFRSLQVTAGDEDLLTDTIGPHAEQMLTTPVGTAPGDTRIVRVTVWAPAEKRAALVVCDKDGVWDEAGIVASSDGAIAEALEYTATNGVSGVRLYIEAGSGPGTLIHEGDTGYFDDLVLDGITFTRAIIPTLCRQNLRRLILRCKPARTWCILFVDYEDEATPLAERSVQALPLGATLTRDMPINIVVTDDEEWLNENGTGNAEEITGSTTLDDDAKQDQIVSRDAPTSTIVTLSAASTYGLYRRFEISNHSSHVVQVKAVSGALVVELQPLSTVNLKLTAKDTTDGTWEFTGYGAGFADLCIVDLRGDAATVTDECTAGATITGSIDVGAVRGECLALRIAGEVGAGSADVHFYSDSARTTEVYGYDAADTGNVHEDPVTWSLTEDTDLVGGVLYYSIKNLGTEVDSWIIDMLIHGVRA